MYGLCTFFNVQKDKTYIFFLSKSINHDSADSKYGATNGGCGPTLFPVEKDIITTKTDLNKEEQISIEDFKNKYSLHKKEGEISIKDKDFQKKYSFEKQRLIWDAFPFFSIGAIALFFAVLIKANRQKQTSNQKKD